MEKEIIELEAQLNRLKRAYKKQQEEQYQNKPHKDFNVGSIVTNGVDIGTVAWTENRRVGLDQKMGYMGLRLISGSRGFIAPVKRDDYYLVTDPYYKQVHTITLKLTGAEIEELKYILMPGSNPSATKKTVLSLLDRVHKS